MDQFDPTAPYEARRDFYRQLTKDPEFLGLSPEDRHDVAKKILFPPERPMISGPGTGELSPTGLKIAAAVEPAVSALSRLAPFPGAIRSFVRPETVPKVEIEGKQIPDLGYQLNPLPEVVTQGFRDVVGGVRSTLGHEPAKLIENVAGAAPFLPLQRLGQIARTIPRYFRKAPTPEWEWLKTREALEAPRRALPAPQEPVVEPTARPVEPIAPSPEGPPPIRPEPVSPVSVSPRVFETAAVERELLRTPEGRLQLMQQRLQARPVPEPEAITPKQTIPRAKRQGRKAIIQLPAVPPVIATPEPTGLLSDPIQDRLETLGIEVPSAETQPLEVKAPSAPETYQESTRLTAKEVVEKIEDQQAPEHFDKPKITKQVEKGGEVYVKTDVDPTELKVPGEKTVEPGISAPEKGPIVVDDKGKVIDGRHRVVDAKEAGETTIEAYLPEAAKMPASLEELDAAAKVRKFKRGDIELDWSKGGKPTAKDALLSDHFAIHKPPKEPNAKTWVVSHRGTGMRLTNVRNLIAAKRIVEQLETVPGVQWDFTEQKGMTRETGMIGKQIVDTKGEYYLPIETPAPTKPELPSTEVEGWSTTRPTDTRKSSMSHLIPPSPKGPHPGAIAAMPTERGWVADYEDAKGVRHYSDEAYPKSDDAFNAAAEFAHKTKGPMQDIHGNRLEPGTPKYDKRLKEHGITLETEAQAKQPWEMTKQEWAEAKYKDWLEHDTPAKALDRKKHPRLYPTPTVETWIREPGSTEHKADVQSALRQGRSIPPEVLADYPDLQAKALTSSRGAVLPDRPIGFQAPEMPRAFDLGKDAFKAGKKRIAPTDIVVRGQGDSWYQGWDVANLAEPVPERTEQTSPLIEAIETAEAAMSKDKTAVDTMRQTHALEKVDKALVGAGPLPDPIQKRLEALGIEVPKESFKPSNVDPMGRPVEISFRDGKTYARYEDGHEIQVEAADLRPHPAVAPAQPVIDIPLEEAQITTRLPDPIGQHLKDPGIEKEEANVPRPADQSTIGVAHGQRAGVDIEPSPIQRPKPVGSDIGGEGSRGGPVRGKAPSRGVGEAGGVGPVEPTDIDATGRPGYVGQPAQADVGGPAEGGLPQAPSQRPSSGAGPLETRPLNHSLPTDRDWIPTGDKAKVRANLEAIRILKTLEEEGRVATSEEKEILAKYIGWGGLKPVFDSSKAAYRTRPGYTDVQKSEAANWEKNWGQLYDQVKTALTPEEYHRAAQSLENAHYTSREVINAIWDAVQQFGFQGGKALEPAVGSGNFLGLTPDKLKGKVKWRAIELDDVSARIAGQLYPEAQVEQADFKDAKISINSQDLIITNVPFSSEIIRGTRYPDFSLHNFYLAKSLDALKPGGILAAITSLSTLEAPIGHVARKYLAERVQLIGAIRLPNDAFLKNAGTEVSTDLLFFRKHDGQSIEGQPFVYLKPAKTYDGKKIELNEYFVDHPEMMLGKMSLEGTMYGRGDEKAVLPNKEPMAPQLREAIAKLPANIMGSTAVTPIEEAPTEKIGGKVGNYIIRDDKVFKVGAGNEAIRPNWANDKARIAQAKRYIGVRDQASELNELQRNPDAGEAEVEAARAELNRRYDDYVARYRHINESGTNFLKDDREFARAAALEEIEIDYKTTEQRTKTGKTVVKKQVTFFKRAIFSRRTIFPTREPVEIDNVPDALDVSFNFRGRPDIEYIAQLTKKTPEAVAEELEASGLAFHDPQTGIWQDRVEYLSGQVKDKLVRVKELVETEPRYLRHVEELEKVQPRYLNIAEFSTRLGASWIPPSIIEQFIRETFDRRATVGVTSETATWHISYPRWERSSEADMTVWGVHGVNGTSMVQHSLNLQSVTVSDPEPDGYGGTRYVVNKGKTLEARNKQTGIEREFQRWVRATPDVASELEPIYNQELNISILPQHRAPSWTHYPGASVDIALRPDQKVAVSRGLKNSVGIFHAPGNGKTYIAATMAMEARRLGLATKPMISVQNSTLEQFPKMFLKLYPNAKTLAPSKDDFTLERRNRTVAQIATEDWDAVIIPHSFFDMIPDDFDRQQRFISDRIEELKAGKIEARRAEGKRSARETDLQRAIRKLEKRLEKLLDSRKDDVFTFEQLGVDMLLIDEFHRYKKLEFDSHKDNIKGLDKDFSQRGLSAYLKIRYVQEKAQGRNVITLTGTPLTNTSAEAWNMIRYIRPDILRRYGIEQFDQFAATFGQTKTELELTAGGTFKEVNRFEGYNNAQQFIQAWLEAADVVMAEMVNLPGLPNVKGGKVRTIELEQTPELAAEIRFIRSELERFDKMSGGDKRENSHIPITMYTRGAKAALDMRLVDPFLPDNPDNKVNATAREALRIYKESRPVKGTMFIFADLHQDRSKGARFDLYKELKRKLVAGGIPEREVVIMDSSVDGAKRAAVLEAFGRGEIAVLIGHSERLGIGVDQPAHAVASIDMDAPHNPMYLEQRHARSVRQGNLNPEVELISLGVKNTLDATRYQRLMAKQKQFNQLLRGNIQGQFVEDPLDELQLSFQDQMAAYSGNLKVIEKVKLENAIREMKTLQLGHVQQVAKARGTFADLGTRMIPKKKEALAKTQADSAKLMAIFGDGKDFEPVLELGGKIYRGKKDMIAVLDTWAKRVIDGLQKQIKEEKISSSVQTKDVVAFSLNGRPIEVHLWSPLSLHREELTTISWRFSGSDTSGSMTTGSGFLGHSLPNVLEKIHLHNPKQLQDEIAIDERSLRELQVFIQQPFERAGELKLAQARLEELIAELRAEGVVTSQTPEAETKEIEFPISMDTIEGLPTEEAAKQDAQIAGLRRSLEAAERVGDTQRVEVLQQRIREIQAK